MRSDEDLMDAYVRGDSAAFRELFARYAPWLVGFLRRRVGNAADAEELAQQTFLQLHRARRDFTPGRAVRPWIMTIAANLARDLLRRRGRRHEERLEPETAAAMADPAQGLVDELVRAAVSALPAPLRAAVELHWFDGLSYEEIGARRGASPGAVRGRAHRGYLALRQAMT